MSNKDNTIYLNPSLDSRKSFYKKASIRTEDNKLILRSYQTDVAFIDLNTKIATVYNMYSNTTTRHIKDFLYQYGFKIGTSKEIMKMYNPNYRV